MKTDNKSMTSSVHSKALASNPLSEDEVLSEFYQSSAKKKLDLKINEDQEASAKPDHYKIVCISLYVEDITRLDQYVRELKKRGHSKANKSQVIRAALEQLDLDKIVNRR